MELEPRTAAPAHATGAVEFVSLAAIADDATFRLREPGDVAALAASIGRLGHLVPVELRPLPGAAGGAPRFQMVAGFRRLAALRLLARGRVLARVHAALDDEDAWAIALAQALLGEPLQAEELERLRERLAGAGVAPWAQELLDEALVRAPVAPERDADAADAPVEVTAEELVEDLARRLYEVNQDLAVAFEAWAELPEEGRRMIVEQARYIAELYPHIAGRRR